MLGAVCAGSNPAEGARGNPLACRQDAEEQRVSELWAGAEPARLRQAADDVRFQLGQSDRFRAGLQRAARSRR